MIHAPGKKLPALRAKASDLRNLGMPLPQVLKDNLGIGDPKHVDMIDGVQALVVVENLLAKHGYAPRMPPRDAGKFTSMVFRFCQCQHSLVRHFHPLPLFNATIKSHYLCELGLISHYINPQLGACWAGEDSMQVARRLLVSSSFGSPPLVAQAGAMQKYGLALNHELHNQSRLVEL